MLTMKQATRSKLDHLTRALADEFGAVPRHQVVDEVDTIANALLQGARFDDYIPLLVHRVARDHLHERQEAGSLAEAV
jgi:hypothetical protein